MLVVFQYGFYSAATRIRNILQEGQRVTDSFLGKIYTTLDGSLIRCWHISEKVRKHTVNRVEVHQQFLL